MPKMLVSSHLRLCFSVVVALMLIFPSSAAAMSPCPSAHERLAQAKVVVEARVKSLSIGESGLLFDENFPTRMIRADLQIRKVIKGKFAGEEATIYGAVYPPGPIQELSVMALLFGFEGHDTFELELSRKEIGDTDTAFFAMSACNYYKFPDDEADPR